MPLPPWSSRTGIEPVVAEWLASGYVRPCLAADRQVAPRVGAWSPMPAGLSSKLVAALHERGIDELSSPQAQAFEAAEAGKHVVVPPPPASGKSLCFHLPVLEALAREPD